MYKTKLIEGTSNRKLTNLKNMILIFQVVIQLLKVVVMLAHYGKNVMEKKALQHFMKKSYLIVK